MIQVGVVGDLIMSGALAHLDNVHVDWSMLKIADTDRGKAEGENVELVRDERKQSFRCGTIHSLLFIRSRYRSALKTLQEVLKSEKSLLKMTDIVYEDDEANSTYHGHFPC